MLSASRAAAQVPERLCDDLRPDADLGSGPRVVVDRAAVKQRLDVVDVLRTGGDRGVVVGDMAFRDELTQQSQPGAVQRKTGRKPVAAPFGHQSRRAEALEDRHVRGSDHVEPRTGPTGKVPARDVIDGSAEDLRAGDVEALAHEPGGHIVLCDWALSA